MESSTVASFLIVFTEAYLTFLIDIDDNLKVRIDDEEVDNFTTNNVTPGAYVIILPSEKLKPCEKTCKANFRFSHPEDIMHNSKHLVKQQQNLTISNFYIVADQLPKQLNQSFLIVSLIIAASSSSSQTSLIKMLFQLQQIIDVHRYLHLEIPVVFKEFVESLMYFRFLDFTAVLSFNVISAIAQLCPNDLDNKGDPKIVFYENGSNFFKNMIQVIIPLVVVLIINLLIFLITKTIPCQITKQFSQKMKIRFIISFSDLLESIIIPTSLFAMFQLAYITWQPRYVWIYAFMYIIVMLLFLFPFYTVTHVATKMRRADQLQVEIYEDLLQDCKIQGSVTYVFYIYNFMKKFMFGFVLAANLPGLIQVLLLLVINSIHLVLMGYIVANNIFNSRIKILTRMLNLVSIIAIEGLILGYNVNYNSI